jgi:quinol monooxygenase YgiN
MPLCLRIAALSVWAVIALALAPASAQSPAPAAPPPRPDAAPLYVIVHVDYVPRRAAEGTAALQQFAADTRKDDGSLRVEIVQELVQPNHLILVEMWRNRAAYDGHLAAAHTIAFRTLVQPMIGSPFDERLGRLAPAP